MKRKASELILSPLLPSFSPPSHPSRLSADFIFLSRLRLQLDYEDYEDSEDEAGSDAEEGSVGTSSPASSTVSFHSAVDGVAATVADQAVEKISRGLGVVELGEKKEETA